MQRPADLGLPSFDSRGPLAIDLVVHHPLSLSENRTSELAKTSLKGAEQHKIANSEALCNANGWLFSPMGCHPWAGVGPHGAAIRLKLEKEITRDLQGWPKRRLLQEFRANMSFALTMFKAKQGHRKTHYRTEQQTRNHHQSSGEVPYSRRKICESQRQRRLKRSSSDQSGSEGSGRGHPHLRVGVCRTKQTNTHVCNTETNINRHNEHKTTGPLQ